jgi:hypothetical protein
VGLEGRNALPDGRASVAAAARKDDALPDGRASKEGSRPESRLDRPLFKPEWRPHIMAAPHIKLAVRIELTDFSVYYTQGAAESAIASMKEGKSEVMCEQGQLYKVSKSKSYTPARDCRLKPAAAR